MRGPATLARRRRGRLTPRVAAVLGVLAGRPQDIVTKQELIDGAWDGLAVSDDALTSCSQELRQAPATTPAAALSRTGTGVVIGSWWTVTPVGDRVATASPGPAPALPDKPSVVVLPFDNLSADPGQDYLADGFAEAITAALSRIRSLS